MGVSLNRDADWIPVDRLYGLVAQHAADRVPIVLAVEGERYMLMLDGEGVRPVARDAARPQVPLFGVGRRLQLPAEFGAYAGVVWQPIWVLGTLPPVTRLVEDIQQPRHVGQAQGALADDIRFARAQSGPECLLGEGRAAGPVRLLADIPSVRRFNFGEQFLPRGVWHRWCGRVV